MSPAIAPLYRRAARLPMDGFLKVWEIATPPERQALTDLFDKKRRSYFKQIDKTKTAQELRTDQTYRRLRSMFPDEAPW